MAGVLVLEPEPGDSHREDSPSLQELPAGCPEIAQWIPPWSRDRSRHIPLWEMMAAMGKAAACLVTTLHAWALPLRGDLGRTGQHESQETKRKHKGAMTHRLPRVERKGQCTKWWVGCWSRGLASEELGLRAPRQRHTGHGVEFGMFQVKRQLLLNLDGLEQPSNFTLAQVWTSSPDSPSTGWLVPGEQT